MLARIFSVTTRYVVLTFLIGWAGRIIKYFLYFTATEHIHVFSPSGQPMAVQIRSCRICRAISTHRYQKN